MKKFARLFKETMIFFNIAFKELRVTGLFTTLLSLVIPLGIMTMVFFLGGFTEAGMGTQLVSGNLTLIISQVCIIFLASKFLQIKLLGGMEQYSVLPINRLAVILGNVLAKMLLIIPYIIILFTVSVIFFKLKLNIHPLALVVILLASVCFSAIGSIVGIYSKNFQKADVRINVIMFLIMFGTPLYYSMKILPIPVQILQFSLPFSYIVDALKKTITFTGYSTRLWLDLIAIGLFAVVATCTASFFFKWKSGE